MGVDWSEYFLWLPHLHIHRELKSLRPLVWDRK